MNFGVSGSLRLWGGGWMEVGGCWGVPPHTCTCTRTHAHACMVNMIISCKWPPPLGEYLGIPYDLICVCLYMRACTCVCTWVGCTLSPPPTPIHPAPQPPGGTPGIIQNSIALELIEIFQFCLKIWNLWRLPHPWVGVWFGGWVGGWVGWWVGSGQITENLKIVDWIKIIQFCLKIYDLWRHHHPWVGVSGLVDGWVNGWSQVKWLKI